MEIWYRCGHMEIVPNIIETAPACLECGEPRIKRVEVRPPRIRGMARGPHVKTERLEAVGVSMGTPLALKE
jgi:hypothetical protein